MPETYSDDLRAQRAERRLCEAQNAMVSALESSLYVQV